MALRADQIERLRGRFLTLTVHPTCTLIDSYFEDNVTLGESGQILSSHYKDQWDEYWAARGLPMHWTEVKGKELRFTPER